MMLLLIFISLLQISYTYNKETNCGCATNRAGGDQLRQESLFHRSENDVDQCPLKRRRESGILDLAERMVLIPAGTYQVGTNDIAIESDNEGPKRLVQLNNFYLDKYEVTNEEFKTFVSDTNYKTEAEQFGDSFVFSAFLNSSFQKELEDYRVVDAIWWYKVAGTDWRHPYGPDSNINDLMDHPVIHVSWNDARAFCKWRNARLPIEAEWEAACRGGHQDTLYPWGNKLFPGRKYMANIWQGAFPSHNSAKDGYIGTNPVDMFPPNDFGLYNMAGNVWEWIEDSWTKNKLQEKVRKGGSYLCHRSYCYRYRCSARSHNSDDSSAGNVGFRCAKTA